MDFFTWTMRRIWIFQADAWMKSHHIASGGEPGRESWSSALHPPSYTVEASGSKEDWRARLRDASDKRL